MRVVSVLIPTLDAGEGFADVVAAVRAQRGDFEVELRVIDSGSTDGTRELLEREHVPHRVIEPSRFDHGLTRNDGILAARGERVALLSQDARPRDDRWLAELDAALDDPRVAGAYSTQVPRPGCHPFQRINVGRQMADAAARQVREPLTPEEFERLDPLARLERIRFDNVASMVRRSVIEAIPFPAAPFGEDLAWSRRVLLAGHRIVFCPRSAVLHSHAVTRREFSTRVRETHEVMKRLTGFVPIGSRALQARRTAGTLLRFWAAVLRDEGLGPARKLWELARAVPYAAMQMEAMFRAGRGAVYEPPGPVGPRVRS